MKKLARVGEKILLGALGVALFGVLFWIWKDEGDGDRTLRTLERFGSKVALDLAELLEESPCLRYIGLRLHEKCQLWDEEPAADSQTCEVDRNLGLWTNASLCSVWMPGVARSRSCLDADGSNGKQLIDLSANPERHTGYSGRYSQRAWHWIYKAATGQTEYENNIYDSRMFEYPKHLGSDRQQIYRIVSGLHASISAHLAQEYFYPERRAFLPNPELFASLVGNHPQRKQNLYLCTILLVSALKKAGTKSFMYGLGAVEYDEASRILEYIEHILLKSRTCKHLLIKELHVPERIIHRALEDIYKVTDCLECERCRLWSKVQILGVWTGIRILYGLDILAPLESSGSNPQRMSSTLSRIEILSFLWTLRRLLESIHYISLHIRSNPFV